MNTQYDTRMAGTPGRQDAGPDRCRRFICRPLSRIEVTKTGVTEYFLTFRPDRMWHGAMESPENLYARVAEFVSSVGGDILQERCYADSGLYTRVLSARRRAYLSHGLEAEGTFCFVGEGPCEAGLDIAGIHMWVVASADGTPSVLPYVVDGLPVGRRYIHDNLCYTVLSSIGPRRDLDGQADRERHAESMFTEAERLLAAGGQKYRDVLRTWIYVPELLTWYDEFNAARRRVFTNAGILGTSTPWLPASTGIQGRCPVGRACKMGVLAVSSLNGTSIEASMVTSPGQCEAFDYGSAFSRAVELRHDGISQMFISGTASIDCSGATVHVDDIRRQTEHTLGVIKGLLEARAHTFGDVVHLVAFLKRAEYMEPFRRIARGMGVDCRLAVETVADVCRDDLLIEIEVMSVRSASGRANGSE